LLIEIELENANPDVCMTRTRIAPPGALSNSMNTQDLGKLPSDARNQPSPRFPITLRVRLPATLPMVIGRAAEKNMMTSSEYIRRSVVDRLRADGFDPTQFAGAA
jgi:hypothetical protein